MSEENIINYNENFLENLQGIIKNSFMLLKGDKNKYAIIQRNQTNKFIPIFGDAIFAYNKGMVLIERFYRVEKCSDEESKIKTLKEEDISLIKEFNAFSQNIPSSAHTTEEEKKEYEDKIKDYQDKISKIKPEIRVINKLHYGNTPLCELDDLSEEQIDNLSSMYSALCVAYTSSMSWNAMNKLSFIVISIDEKDYSDLLLVPVRPKEED